MYSDSGYGSIEERFSTAARVVDYHDQSTAALLGRSMLQVDCPGYGLLRVVKDRIRGSRPVNDGGDANVLAVLGDRWLETMGDDRALNAGVYSIISRDDELLAKASYMNGRFEYQGDQQPFYDMINHVRPPRPYEEPLPIAPDSEIAQWESPERYFWNALTDDYVMRTAFNNVWTSAVCSVDLPTGVRVCYSLDEEFAPYESIVEDYLLDVNPVRSTEVLRIASTFADEPLRTLRRVKTHTTDEIQAYEHGEPTEPAGVLRLLADHLGFGIGIEYSD